MNIAFFIALRAAKSGKKTFSSLIIKLSITATAISVAAMIIATCFVNGFQQSIAQKVFNFWGNLRIQHYGLNKALVSEENPIERDTTIENILKNNTAIQSFNVFATKSAVLEKKGNIEGILFKGIDKNFDSTRITKFIQKGNWIKFTDSTYSKEIIISAHTAKELNVNVADTIKIFFVNDEDNTTTTYRKLVVKAIYHTGIEEYDNLFCLGDIQLIQFLNNWQYNEIGGYEVLLRNYKDAAKVSNELNLPGVWTSKTLQEVQPTIFDWLAIQDTNRNVLFIIMGVVAVINLITCLIILVLERTQLIGTLKALGANNALLQKIFIIKASIIAVVGVLIGLLVGLGICVLQQQTGFITLDESNYYISVAPVSINFWQIVLICVATILVCILSLTIPSFIIRKMQPVKALRFN